MITVPTPRIADAKANADAYRGSPTYTGDAFSLAMFDAIRFRDVVWDSNGLFTLTDQGLANAEGG